MSDVSQDGTTWVTRTEGLTVRFDTQTLAFSMRREGGRAWRMGEDGSHDLMIQPDGAAYEVSLAQAERKEVREYRSGELHGVRVLLRGFPHAPELVLALIVAIDVVSEEVVVRIVPVEEPVGLIGLLRYPRPFEMDAVGPRVFHVLPAMQGCLLPPDWPATIEWWRKGQAYTGALYMPWWGALRPGDAYMGILETPCDAGVHLDHPAGGPTHAGPKWFPSMGALRYARQVRYVLFGDVDHNALAARYREYVRTAGRLKTLETKATELPPVRQLEGATIATAYTLYHIQPDSHYYDPEHPERNHRLVPFAETIAELERFAKAYPSKRVVLHLDGWGLRGYDNLHPDILPPCPEAGGWEGFRALADACAERGWLFCTHDNYIDYYLDAATYSDDLAVWSDPQGTIPKKAWWHGGAQAFLCEKNALGYVRRNFEEILRHGVKLGATYIDVYSIMEPFECYHPDHRMTREESIAARAAVFAYVRSKGIVVSSEEPTDWSVPHLDFCYWAPLAQSGGLFKGRPIGIPVPLFNGVYHDCIVTPWNLAAQGEINSAEVFLYALSFGGAPLVSASGRAERSAELERARLLAEVHRQTGFAPIERHELLDTDGTRRLTTFAGGAAVEVDFRKRRYRLKGLRGLPKRWQDVPE